MTRTPSLSLALALAAASPALAQLRIAAWNVSNYDGTGARDPSFRTAIYATYQGRSMAPDILIAQEIANATGAGAFLQVLNSAPGSPGDWSIAPFVQGPDTSLAFYYRTSKLTFLGQTLVAPGGNTNGVPRDIRRYDVRLVGYAAPSTTLAIYGDHMKAGSAGSDQSRRLQEAMAIRADANNLPPGWQFLLGGDFNIQSSTQSAYQELVGSLAVNRGRFVDPIDTPGDWNNNAAFRFVQTQAPGGTSSSGGMDDRFDFLLLGADLTDGAAFDYIGDPSTPYSTTTWNDPNHSFRAWGQDGTYFNSTINITSNAMVGPTIAAAIKATCDTDTAGGHLPVFLDLRVPAHIASPLVIDFGQVPQGSLAQQVITVSNGGDVSLWTAQGIADLRYTLSTTAGFSAPAGPFAAPPGAPGNTHTITMSTADVGPISGTLTIASDDPDEPARPVMLTGEVVGAPACYPNCDGSTTPPILNINDFACFANRFASGDPYANCDGSTTPPILNINDFACFANAFAAGCR